MSRKKTAAKPDVFEMILTAQAQSPVLATPSAGNGAWHLGHEEGELAVDVIDAGDDMVVLSTISGAQPGAIEVYIHNDLLTIRGERHSPLEAQRAAILHHECFWGKFSRTIVLPAEMKADLARAEYKYGVLMVRIPKRSASATIPVLFVEE